MWRKYYNVITITRVYPAGFARDPEVSWIIVYSDECNDNAGRPAYEVEYRTERHAIKGAERLYKRTHGWIEEALGLDVV
jgi:hypothetical protein